MCCRRLPMGSLEDNQGRIHRSSSKDKCTKCGANCCCTNVQVPAEPICVSDTILNKALIHNKRQEGSMSKRTGSKLQMNQLSLRNNWLKFKTAGKLPIILEEFIEYTPI